MSRWQGRSLRKPTGGRIWPRKEKRKSEMGSEFIEAKLAPPKLEKLRIFGGGEKLRLLSSDLVNVADPSSGKTVKVKLLSVLENPADPHFVRRNVLTRGTVIETELGKARVTSRPGQHGVVNAVLLERK